MTSTLQGRLILWYLLITTLVLTLFATLLYISISSSLVVHHDEELVQESDRLASRLAAAGPGPPSAVLDGGPGMPMFVLLRGPNREPLYISSRLRK